MLRRGTPGDLGAVKVWKAISGRGGEAQGQCPWQKPEVDCHIRRKSAVCHLPRSGQGVLGRIHWGLELGKTQIALHTDDSEVL